MSTSDELTVTSYLCAKPAAEAIDFYKRAFGAEETGGRYMNEDGTIGHAEFHIGATTFYISDEAPGLNVLSPLTLKGSSVSFSISTPDAEATFAQAIAAGARLDRPLADEPYGRSGWLSDPFGYRWNICQPPAGD